MPAIRTPSLPSFGKPYDTVHCSSRFEKAPFVRIHSPSLDIPFVGHLSYEALEDNHSLTHWMSVGPFFPEPEVYESASCPPSFTSTPELPDSPSFEPLDGTLFHWPYEGHAGSCDSFTVPLSHSSTFSPTASLVSCSPRSDHSLSLSPQPPEPPHAYKFDYTMPSEFPPPSSLSLPTLPLSRSPKSSVTASSRSGDTTDKKRPSKSRDDSPSRNTENDARRRFPCLIIGCERRFTSQYTLKVHMEAHKPKPRTSFPCTLGCNERFSRQHDRLRHEVAKHGKVCEFSCDECGRFFSTRKTLGNHKCPVAQGGTRWVTN